MIGTLPLFVFYEPLKKKRNGGEFRSRRPSFNLLLAESPRLGGAPAADTGVSRPVP